MSKAPPALRDDLEINVVQPPPTFTPVFVRMTYVEWSITLRRRPAMKSS